MIDHAKPAENLKANKESVRFWLFLSAAFGLAALLFLFDPARSRLSVCVFHNVTGRQCPTCGLTRAVHQLLHGNFIAAWSLNPLIFLIAPTAGYLFLRYTVSLFTGKRWPGIPFRMEWLWVLVGGLLLYGVLRNL